MRLGLACLRMPCMPSDSNWKMLVLLPSQSMAKVFSSVSGIWSFFHDHPALLHQVQGVLDEGQGLEAQEVHLYEAAVFQLRSMVYWVAMVPVLASLKRGT
jgi:hypothetical protein